MADTIPRNNILDNIVETLQAIDSRDGYNFDIRNESVTRMLKPWSEITMSDLPYLIVSDGSESYNYTGMGKRVTNFFTVIIRGIVEDNSNPSEELNKLIADVKKAILIDLTRGTTNGERNASNTMLIRTDTDQGMASPRAVFEMEIQVTYHTLDSNR